MKLCSLPAAHLLHCSQSPWPGSSEPLLHRISSPGPGFFPSFSSHSPQNGFVCVLTAEGQEASEVTLTWLATNRFPPHPGERAC